MENLNNKVVAIVDYIRSGDRESRIDELDSGPGHTVRACQLLHFVKLH